MAFYEKKFRSVIDDLPFIENQTKTGRRLGIDFLFTCNPEVIEKIHNSGNYKRSEVGRRIVEHDGAENSMVAQKLKKVRVKRPEFKKFMNPKIYKNILKTSLDHLDNLMNIEKQKNKTDVFNCVIQSVKQGFASEWLGIEFDEKLKKELNEHSLVNLTYEESFEKIAFLNFFYLPLWLKFLFTPKLKEKSKRIKRATEIIYNKATVKSGGWLDHLKKLEANKVLTKDDVLGEILGVFISTHTLSSVITWSIYRLYTHDPKHIESILQSEEYARYTFMETLRLHPPFVMVSYEKQSKCPFHRKNINVVSIKQTLKNPKYWENPEVFWPLRFQKGMKNLEKKSYIPFGGGERICPGISLTMHIGPKFIEEFVKRYKLTNIEKPVLDKKVKIMSDVKFFAKVKFR